MRRSSLPTLFVASLLAWAGATSALAVQTPQPGLADTRVRTVDYDPLQVVRITGVYRTATQILFGEDETILHVAVGDATAWDVAAEKNILFIKPKAAHGDTDMIVTTARPDGRARNYIFELTMGAHGRRGAGAQGLFVLRFAYPSDQKTAAGAAIQAEEAVVAARLTAMKLERGVVEGPRNLHYEIQGAEALAPSEVSDNGRFTILRFHAGQAIPAVYQVLPDGAESLVAFDVRGEFAVIHGTAKAFRLRRGRDVLCIYNEALDPYGVNLGTQTASPDIERTDKGAPAARPHNLGDAR